MESKCHICGVVGEWVHNRPRGLDWILGRLGGRRACFFICPDCCGAISCGKCRAAFISGGKL